MRVPYNWLKNYIDFPHSPEELAKELTMAGLEVEEIDYFGEGLEELIVGKIKNIKEHPNADKLVICEVDIGEKILQIITGAPNVKEGIKVPVAEVGVKLPNGMEIEATELRGEPSHGMICSEDELGLTEERQGGIMILSDEMGVGNSFVSEYGLDEYVYKLDLTPNYARCLGLIGIAREIKARLDHKTVNYPEFEIDTTEEDIEDLVDVSIEDEDLCPRYTGRVIKNVEIGPSPEWMQRRLNAAGIRPVNNVVDITNYVLLEYNQPLHAFDYDKISGEKIIVRRAQKQENLVTLDDTERELDEEVLVIADEEKAVGMAGVMGGANSEVTEETRNVFLESAYFAPLNIRTTATKHSLHSEASHRFEREVDIESLIPASNRAAYLMEEYAGGEVVEGIIDKYPNKKEDKWIDLKTDKVNRLLGLSLETEEIKNMLERLEFEIQSKVELLKVKVPTYRNDVQQDADLVEEVARMYGYNNIPETRPDRKQQGGIKEGQEIRYLAKDFMRSSGLDEVINFSLINKNVYDKMRIDENSKLNNWVEVKNPLSEAFGVMRTSLIPGIVEVLSKNAKRQAEQMGVFEVGKVFFNQGKGKRPEEKRVLAGGSMGYTEDKWDNDAPDFFYLKGILDELFERLGLNGVKYSPDEVSYLHPGRTASIVHEGDVIGEIGELLPDLVDEFDLKVGTTVFQLDFGLLSKRVNYKQITYKSIPSHPSVSRDLAVVTDEDIAVAELTETMEKEAGNLLESIDVFDLYRGDPIPEGKKSIAFKLLFRAKNRTLTDDEVNKLFNSVIDTLKEQFDAEIRGN